MAFTTRPVSPGDIDDLILFDKTHLIDMIKRTGIKANRCPPMVDRGELLAAFDRNDFIYWLYRDNNLAGYMWRTIQSDCLFGVGAAIKQEFYGTGLSHFIIESTEDIARNHGLNICRLNVLPENGRAISAWMKHGYRIVGCISGCNGHHSTQRFLCIMEKNIKSIALNKIISDRQEIVCTEESGINMLIQNGYIGIQFIKNSAEDPAKNKIVFVL